MRENVNLKGEPLEENQYCEIVKELVSKKYSPIIDPRNFDSPISIKARFKLKDSRIRFIEFSPNLELSIEHSLPKAKAKVMLKKITNEFENTIRTGEVKAEDFEFATLKTVFTRNPVLVPKNEAEEKLFRSLQEKGIFSKAVSVVCPECSQTFMFPSKDLKFGDKKAFCADCKKWFAVKVSSEVYIVNEEYMEVMDGVWEKVQKLVRTSWREVTKRGLPALKP